MIEQENVALRVLDAFVTALEAEAVATGQTTVTIEGLRAAVDRMKARAA